MQQSIQLSRDYTRTVFYFFNHRNGGQKIGRRLVVVTIQIDPASTPATSSRFTKSQDVDDRPTPDSRAFTLTLINECDKTQRPSTTDQRQNVFMCINITMISSDHILSLSSRPLCSLWHYWSQHIAYSSVVLVRHSRLRFRLV